MEKQREIKFRAFDKRTRQMYRVGSIELIDRLEGRTGVNVFTDEDKSRFNHWIDSMHLELMQFTGLRDKNGKEIYEGDIIVQDRYPFFKSGKSNYVGVVEWVFSQWQYVLRVVAKDKRGISDGINCSMNDTGFEEGEKTDFEVIGNIYENPDLLTN